MFSRNHDDGPDTRTLVSCLLIVFSLLVFFAEAFDQICKKLSPIE